MADFNEREFEFLFNAEFVRIHKAALLGTPIIPTPRMERFLGYDIEFRIKNGTFSRSLFIQHKVPDYVRKSRKPYQNIFNCYNGPYYRFPITLLDKSPQHNLLRDLAAKGEEVYYCSALFHEVDELQKYFASDSVIEHSRFFSLSSMPIIIDMNQHHVSYDVDGKYGYFHSDPGPLESLLTWGQIQDRSSQKIVVNQEYLQKLLVTLIAVIETRWHALPSIPDSIKEKGLTMQTVYLLRRYFNVQWLILP